MDGLQVHRGEAPLVLAFPHTGTDLPDELLPRLASPWRGRKDADWWIDKLYDFARDLGATLIRTTVSRTVIDVNRDPSGAPLYPGQATTELCPTTTFDGEPLYLPGQAPDAGEIAARRARWFDPYHAAIETELTRLRAAHARVVLYDAHSIRSHIPRLFDGELPQFNVGTNSGAACDAALSDAVMAICAESGRSHVRDGRFKGGWTTRHYGRPALGVHAIQMELACRGYMAEPSRITPETWPTAYRSDNALRPILQSILAAILAFTQEPL